MNPDPADLLDLAYPYALDAVTAADRAAIELLRDRASPYAAAEFDAVVATVHDIMAVLAILDAHPPPPGLEPRLLHALGEDPCPGHWWRGRRWGSPL